MGTIDKNHRVVILHQVVYIMSIITLIKVLFINIVLVVIHRGMPIVLIKAVELYVQIDVIHYKHRVGNNYVIVNELLDIVLLQYNYYWKI